MTPLTAVSDRDFARFQALIRDEAERVRMLDAICTNETHFFREPRHFEYLARRVVPSLCAEADAGRRARQVRAWSAACSTGEEPYSLAMTLLGALPPGWDVRILATDLSTKVLARATEGLYSMDKACEIPEPYLVSRALAILAPGGQLFMGHAESLAGMTISSRPVFPIVYAREAPGRAEEAAA